MIHNNTLHSENELSKSTSNARELCAILSPTRVLIKQPSAHNSQRESGLYSYTFDVEETHKNQESYETELQGDHTRLLGVSSFPCNLLNLFLLPCARWVWRRPSAALKKANAKWLTINNEARRSVDLSQIVARHTGVFALVLRVHLQDGQPGCGAVVLGHQVTLDCQRL